MHVLTTALQEKVRVRYNRRNVNQTIKTTGGAGDEDRGGFEMIEGRGVRWPQGRERVIRRTGGIRVWIERLRGWIGATGCEGDEGSGVRDGSRARRGSRPQPGVSHRKCLSSRFAKVNSR